ncbi:unnamed protein product [Amoebophrya sp. A25]|nr:unnamed protein product [Amoebophrya sp. A25]|eukprot:GSA25T00004250001.1
MIMILFFGVGPSLGAVFCGLVQDNLPMKMLPDESMRIRWVFLIAAGVLAFFMFAWFLHHLIVPDTSDDAKLREHKETLDESVVLVDSARPPVDGPEAVKLGPEAVKGLLMLRTVSGTRQISAHASPQGEVLLRQLSGAAAQMRQVSSVLPTQGGLADSDFDEAQPLLQGRAAAPNKPLAEPAQDEDAAGPSGLARD